VSGRAVIPPPVVPVLAEFAKNAMVCRLNFDAAEVVVMSSLFTTRTSPGRTDDERGGRSSVLAALIVLAAIVLITALTCEWALRAH